MFLGRNSHIIQVRDDRINYLSTQGFPLTLKVAYAGVSPNLNVASFGLRKCNKDHPRLWVRKLGETLPESRNLTQLLDEIESEKHRKPNSLSIGDYINTRGVEDEGNPTWARALPAKLFSSHYVCPATLITSHFVSDRSTFIHLFQFTSEHDTLFTTVLVTIT